MRQEKQYLYNEIEDQMNQTGSVIVTAYQSLQPNTSWKLRSSLKEVGATLEVVKKRIFLKAAKEKQIDVKLDDLTGHIGVIFAGKDVIQSTKALFQFEEENEGMIQPLFAYAEGNFYTASQVKELATLPSESEMRAQFLGLLEAPMAETLSVMQSLLTSVMYCLENKEKSS